MVMNEKQKLNKVQKQRALRGALLSLCNVMYSVSIESESYLTEAELKTVRILSGNLDLVLNSVKKGMNRKMIDDLETRTDLDYRLWVETHLVNPKLMDLFTAEMHDVIKKYSL